MISKRTMMAIKQSIGARPIIKIRAHAHKEKFFNNEGKMFSRSTFSRVLNGTLELPYIEDFILNYAEICRQVNETRTHRKEIFTQRIESKELS